jgi:(1->4)-alpha-D-glucan 1-alpha-D-glucosylmutase
LLEEISGNGAADLGNAWQDGREKLFVTARLLALRRARPELFAAGDYQPIGIEDRRHADRLCAFVRRHDGEGLVTIVPHLTYDLFRDGGPADFGNTEIVLPVTGSWRNVFTGAMLAGRDRIRASELFRGFPVAVLFADGLT